MLKKTVPTPEVAILSSQDLMSENVYRACCLREVEIVLASDGVAFVFDLRLYRC